MYVLLSHVTMMLLGEYAHVSPAGHCLAQCYMTRPVTWHEVRTMNALGQWITDDYWARVGYSFYRPQVEGLSQLLPFVSFLRVPKSQNIVYVWYVTFVPDRCLHSLCLMCYMIWHVFHASFSNLFYIKRVLRRRQDFEYCYSLFKRLKTDLIHFYLIIS